MAQFPFEISLLQTLVPAFVIRLVLCCAVSLAMLKVSQISKSSFSAVMINLAVFALPTLVALLIAV